MRFPRYLTLLAVISALGCGGQSQYRYRNQIQAKRSDTSHKVKDISAPLVDMLWVVDNSGSMFSYQQSVATNLGAFIDTLALKKNLYWKIGMISTSLGEKPYLGFDPGDELTWQDPKATDKFKNAISKLGTSGDSVERTYEPVVQTLTNYPNFVRKTASFDLILVSDAPEQSNMTTAEFYQNLTQLVGDSSKISFYGVLDPSDWCPSTDDPFSWSGSKFEELLKLVKGAAYKICDADYSPNLIDIANKVVRGVTITPRILLESKPIPETLQVSFRGALLP